MIKVQAKNQIGKGDFKNFEGGMVVCARRPSQSISETAYDFYTKYSLRFIENSLIRDLQLQSLKAYHAEHWFWLATAVEDTTGYNYGQL